VQRDLTRYLADRRIVRDLGKQTNSRLAALTLLWLKRESKQLVSNYVRNVFEGYWRGELDIEDESALRSLLQKIGAPLPGYETFVRGEGLAVLDRVRSNLLNAGVFDVPAYVIAGEVFVGREHLTLIRNRLGYF